MMKYRTQQAKTKGRKYQIRCKPVPLSSVARSLQKAVVIAEDERFYDHHGIDFEAVKKAYEYNRKRGRVIRGGSTISQQVAKNLWLSPKRSRWRKLVEAVLTVRMELALSKDRILELYLNTIEWGDGIFGAAAASKAYFNTTPGGLSAPQAALLAAAIPSPLRSNPARPSAYLLRRQQAILNRLHYDAPHTEEQAAEPKAETETEPAAAASPDG